MLTEENIFDQLREIKKHQPVFSGDISHKEAKNELMKRKWVMLYENKYVVTDLGNNILGADEVRNKSVIKKGRINPPDSIKQ